ncbi:ABC transporter permease [Candidatus Gracilibacteria bacterium]|nr:ABC transporter permease [Candidatus Gracilibacteria bacterium]
MTDLYTLTRKEVARFLRVWKQTLLPPIITIVLYLAIFGKFIGDRISVVEGVNYIDFIFPGLLMMSVIMASYQNTSSSFFGSKFQKSIEELFVSPIAYWKILVGFCAGAMLRGIMVAGLVFVTGALMTDIIIQNYFLAFVFIFLSSLLFSLLGLYNGLYAKSFDDIALIPTFVITPLIYLGGVFYPISVLGEPWQTISLFNPILYMINGLRYAFIGVSDISVATSIGILLFFITILIAVILYLLKKGYGIRS